MGTSRGGVRMQAAHEVRRFGALALAVALVMTLLGGLTGCVPSGAAVGDTRTSATNVTHDSVDAPDMLIGVVSAGQPDLDRRVMDAFDAAELKAVYASVPESGTPASAASQSVEGFVSRPVKVIVVAALDCSASQSKAENPQWVAALQSAREAGIPVVLINPVRAPADEKLYAEILTIADSSETAGAKESDGKASSKIMAIADAVALAVNDNPHPKRITVTLNS